MTRNYYLALEFGNGEMAIALMRDDVNWHEVEACVGSEFVYIVIALAAAVFH